MNLFGFEVSIRRTRPDPCVTVPTQPEAKRAANRPAYRWQIMNAGGATLTATCNVAPGTLGWEVHQMVDEGLLVGPTITRSAHGPNYDRYVYTVPSREAEGEI